MEKRRSATYVFCLIADSRAPILRHVPDGPPGTGPVRLLSVDLAPASTTGSRTTRGKGLAQWLVVADARLAVYGAPAIDRRLNDLEWVSRAAVAHEAVVEWFMKSTAVLPMKLLTLFSSDERAVMDLRSQRAHINAAVKRVANHDEWGVRVILDGAPKVPVVARRPSVSGSGYLKSKKVLRDARSELTRHARDVVADVYERLVAEASLGRRRTEGELPVEDGPLLLDAAFLVPRSRSVRFRAAARRAVKDHGRKGYRLTMSGPWPPYSFMKD